MDDSTAICAFEAFPHYRYNAGFFTSLKEEKTVTAGVELHKHSLEMEIRGPRLGVGQVPMTQKRWKQNTVERK